MKKIFSSLLFIFLSTSLAQANTIHVTSNAGDDAIIGNCSLREAIEAANTDQGINGCSAGSGADVIEIPAGLYTLTRDGSGENKNQTGDLDIWDSVTIRGIDTEETTLDAGNLDRMFDIWNGNVSFEKLTIRNGQTNDSLLPEENGGAISIHFPETEPMQITLRNIRLEENSAFHGGAIAAIAPDALPDFPLEHTLEVSEVEINDNQALGDGGGVYANANLPAHLVTHISKSSIHHNQAGHSGGGLALYQQKEVQLFNTTLHQNEAGSLLSSDPKVEDSANPDYVGSAFLIVGHFLDLRHLTLTENISKNDESSGNFTAAAALIHFPSSGGKANVSNSLFANNSGGDCTLGLYDTPLDISGGHNLDSDGTCNLDAGLGDLPKTDPLLSSLGSHGGPTSSQTPLSNSPLIDAGDASTCLTEDQRNLARPWDGNLDGSAVCDIGATEYVKFSIPVPKCGNGTREWGEMCDDGNVTDGDGCSSSCTLDRLHFDFRETDWPVSPLPTPEMELPLSQNKSGH